MTPTPTAAAMMMVVMTADMNAGADRSNMDSYAIGLRGWCGQKTDREYARNYAFHLGIPVDWSLLNPHGP